MAEPAITSREAVIRATFRVSLVFKGVLSLLEIAAGTLALFVSTSEFVRLVVALTQEELSEDPHDFVATHLLAAASRLSIGSQHFAAFYLLSHGAVKTFLVAGLLRERLWYYPVAIAAFGAFVAYQLVRFRSTHSLWLLVLTVVDVVVIVLTWHEYRYLRRHGGFE
jgi:uncharacterized membrane protein